MALCHRGDGPLPSRSADLPHRLLDFQNRSYKLSSRDWSTSCSCRRAHHEALTIQQRLFDNSLVTPAARANDATDIHVIAGGLSSDRRLLRTATLDHIQCGRRLSVHRASPRG